MHSIEKRIQRSSILFRIVRANQIDVHVRNPAFSIIEENNEARPAHAPLAKEIDILSSVLHHLQIHLKMRKMKAGLSA